MMSVLTFLFSHFFLCAWALRAANEEFPQIGKHFPIFVFEKNENPQNILVTYIKLDRDCRLEQDKNNPAQPVVGFYWLMGRLKYKPVHPLIQKGIRDRLKFLSQSDDRRSFKMRLSDLKELKQDLKSTEISIAVAGHGADCKVDATLTLGPSNQSQVIRLEKVYSNASKTFFPPFRKIQSVTLSGQAVASGENISQTYPAR